METKIMMDADAMKLTNINEKKDRLHHLFCQDNDKAMQLYKEWCLETHNGRVPFTSMKEWESHCKDYNVSPTKIGEFSNWHKVFYAVSGIYYTYESVADALWMGEFDECITYYAENAIRFKKVEDLFSKDPYVVVNSNNNLYI